MAERDVALANHMLASILNDLEFLKDNSFLSVQTYNEVVAALPSRVNDVPKPKLPTRKSNGSSVGSTLKPVPAPREPAAIPKLPVRRSTGPTPAAEPTTQPRPTPTPRMQPRAMPMPAVATPEPHTAPPPAYTAQPEPPAPPAPLATAEALYDYEGDDPSSDLSFRQGDIIQVIEYVNDDWWRGELNGKTGIFPQNHVQKLAPTKRPTPPKPTPKPATLPSTHQQSTYTPASRGSPVATHNNNNSNEKAPLLNQAPYSYPPPPAMYQPPPPGHPAYGVPAYGAPPPAAPSTAQYYGAPPPVQAAQAQDAHGGEHDEGKVASMAKKFGGNVATAATWGFGATLGSQAANAIF